MAEVYAICFPNGKLYVGITTRTAEVRFHEHLVESRQGSRNVVHRAIRKYSEQALRLVVLRRGVSWGEACLLEKHYIRELRTRSHQEGYNETSGGEGTPGLVPSAETRARISKSNRGKKRSEETRKRMSTSSRARYEDPELRAKVIQRLALLTEAQKGKPLSPETRQKLSRALKGKPHSPLHRAKLAEHCRRMASDPVIRQKVAEAHRGARRSPEARERIAKANQIKAADPGHRQKLSQGQKRRWADPSKQKDLLQHLADITEANRGRKTQSRNSCKDERGTAKIP